MRSKTAVVEHHIEPGPGQYNPGDNSKSMKSPNTVIGKAARGKNYEPNKMNPGPGAYGNDKSGKEGPAFSFGNTKHKGKEEKK